jgi:hypothetical protein
MKIIGFLIKHLLVIHKGTIAAKLKTTLILAISTSPIAYIIEKITTWSVENSEYILFVLGAIMIDHLLGSFVHAFVKRDFTWKKNLQGLVVKIGLAVAMGFIFEGVNHIIKEASFVKSYLIIVLRLAVFLYPAGSAAMNSAIITKGKFPPIGFLDKIKKFNTSLDLSHFKKNDEEN